MNKSLTGPFYQTMYGSIPFTVIPQANPLFVISFI